MRPRLCEALQWPLYFDLPQSHAALRADRALWLQWTARLTLSAYRDPEYDYWQVLASRQSNDELQFHWQSFVADAGRTRSLRYLNLGLLALARLPLSDDDSLHNLRLQVQALVNRYTRRKGWGTAALEELAEQLSGVRARNPSLSTANYRLFLRDMLTPLGEDRAASVLGILGLAQAGSRYTSTTPRVSYKLEPPAHAGDTDEAVRARTGQTVWLQLGTPFSACSVPTRTTCTRRAMRTTLCALDRCARALCNRFSLRDPEIRARLFQWIHLALRLEPEDPRLWMLWELALRQADQPQRAQWVLWEMTRRFPNDLHCRLDLARLLANSTDAAEQNQAQRLLQQVLQLDPEDLYAHSTLAQLAIRHQEGPGSYARPGGATHRTQ
jgi:cytochrome c-type biogenesis protein CcmH/NrfG